MVKTSQNDNGCPFDQPWGRLAEFVRGIDRESDREASRSSLEELITGLGQLVPFDGATLYLSDAVGDLTETLSLGSPVSFLNYLSLGENSGLQGWAAINRQPVLIPVRRNPESSIEGGEYRAIMAIPLVSGDAVRGVINLGSFVAGTYDDRSLFLAELATGYLALHIDNVILKRRNNALCIKLNDSQQEPGPQTAPQDMVSKLHEAAQTAAEVNHEINNPLSVIIGNVQCLVMEKVATTQKSLSRLRRIESAALRISQANRRLGIIRSLIEDEQTIITRTESVVE